jgi:pheromone shutdown-related protein TraB
MANIIILGTSHIAQQSVDDIKRAIIEEKPDIIAIELDKKRLHALLSGQKAKIRIADIGRIGFKGWLFVIIGQFIQKKLGKIVGMDPGSDMLEAINQAKQHNIQLALIDQDIEVTLRRFSKTLSWKERFRFVADIFKGIFAGKKQAAHVGLDNLDLSSVPTDELITKMVTELKKRYPNIYRTLITERNTVMIHRLAHLATKNPDKKILAVVGAGHKDALQDAFSSLPLSE